MSDHITTDTAALQTRAMSRRHFGAAAAGAMLMLPRAVSATDGVHGDPHGSPQGRQPSLRGGQKDMTTVPVVRISIARCDPARFDRLRQLMLDSEAKLRPGIEQMPGLLAFYSGADPATHSFSNTSLWDTLEHAQQLDHFQPMLEAGKRFVAEGAEFERPIMNYPTLWRFGPMSNSQR